MGSILFGIILLAIVLALAFYGYQIVSGALQVIEFVKWVIEEFKKARN
jgi:hypothetical protein